MLLRIKALLWRPSVGIVFIAASLALFALAISKTPPPEPEAPLASIHCIGEDAQNFSCWRSRLETVTERLGPKIALRDIKTLYNNNPYIASQCHQLTHTIGNTAAEKFSDIADAFVPGDSICWSGYYHGVVEKAVQQFGKEGFLEKADQLCAKIPGKDTYNFDYYNCVHGLGHGVLGILRGELFEALSLCNSLSGQWERSSCWGGVYMENIMNDHRGQKARYLKPDDLLYPCNAVEETYKEECYKMQTSYALSQNGRSFKNLFELCARADLNYRNTCAESIGRDASGQTVSNVNETIANCNFALDDTQEEHCIIGAVKDFVSYFHSDKEARNFCFAVEQRFQPVCERALLNHWQTM